MTTPVVLYDHVPILNVKIDCEVDASGYETHQTERMMMTRTKGEGRESRPISAYFVSSMVCQVSAPPQDLDSDFCREGNDNHDDDNDDDGNDSITSDGSNYPLETILDDVCTDYVWVPRYELFPVSTGLSPPSTPTSSSLVTSTALCGDDDGNDDDNGISTTTTTTITTTATTSTNRIKRLREKLCRSTLGRLLVETIPICTSEYVMQPLWGYLSFHVVSSSPSLPSPSPPSPQATSTSGRRPTTERRKKTVSSSIYQTYDWVSETTMDDSDHRLILPGQLIDLDPPPIVPATAKDTLAAAIDHSNDCDEIMCPTTGGMDRTTVVDGDGTLIVPASSSSSLLPSSSSSPSTPESIGLTDGALTSSSFGWWPSRASAVTIMVSAHDLLAVQRQQEQNRHRHVVSVGMMQEQYAYDDYDDTGNNNKDDGMVHQYQRHDHANDSSPSHHMVHSSSIISTTMMTTTASLTQQWTNAIWRVTKRKSRKWYLVGCRYSQQSIQKVFRLLTHVTNTTIATTTICNQIILIARQSAKRRRRIIHDNVSSSCESRNVNKRSQNGLPNDGHDEYENDNDGGGDGSNLLATPRAAVTGNDDNNNDTNTFTGECIVSFMTDTADPFPHDIVYNNNKMMRERHQVVVARVQQDEDGGGCDGRIVIELVPWMK